MNKPKCKACEYCKQSGRTTGKYSGKRSQRNTYYCRHPKVHELKDSHGCPLLPFIGYGRTVIGAREHSPLMLKTHKKWCPLLKEDKSYLEIKEKCKTDQPYRGMSLMTTMEIYSNTLNECIITDPKSEKVYK